MCDHSSDKPSTYLEIFDSIGEVYMCECGAVIDIDSERGMQDLPMTPEELEELVQDLVIKKVKVIKAAIDTAVEGA